LNAFLEHVDQLMNEESNPAKKHLRIVDPQQLQTATEPRGEEPIVLVRPDFLVIGFSAASVREFNAQLDKGAGSFAANPLGQRITKAYQDGTDTVFAADVQKLLSLIPQDSPKTAEIMAMLDKTGFGAAQYALLESKISNKKSETAMELMFNGTRHGIASWV